MFCFPEHFLKQRRKWLTIHTMLPLQRPKCYTRLREWLNLSGQVKARENRSDHPTFASHPTFAHVAEGWILSSLARSSGREGAGVVGGYGHVSEP